MKKKHINSPFPKPERDAKVIELYKNKNLSYRSLAKIFHISSTRIMQIIKKGK